MCEKRDPKVVYGKGRTGDLVGFNGVDGPYEAPTEAELRLDEIAAAVGEIVERVLSLVGAVDR